MSKEFFEYKIKNIDSDLLNKIRVEVQKGEKLMRDLNDGPIKTEHDAWMEGFTWIISTIDPLGTRYRGCKSIAKHWYSAQYYSRRSLNSEKNHDKDRPIIFGQCVGIARLLLNGKVKVVQKDNTPPHRESISKLEDRCIFHRRTISQDKSLVFVLMPFTASWSNYIWTKQIKPAVESVKKRVLICQRADDLFGQDVMQDIYEAIVRARIIIADITDKNANVFYELGMAHALGKDVIILSQGEEHIPFDLQRFRHCIYSNDGPGYEKLASYLPEAIQSILDMDKS